MKKFSEMNLKLELVEALNQIGFRDSTEVQEAAIPTVLQHKDVIVRSKTGSGKTGAFLVPILQMADKSRGPEALVVVPTRELAIQVHSVAEKLSRKMGLHTVIVYGGASINVQMDHLARGANIVIGTPGRILDLVDRNALRLGRVKFLVLDEADLMLDMGFIEDVSTIMSMTPKERQTMLFSATMPREIVDIARKHMRPDTVRITVGKEEEVTVNTITHNYFVANGRYKFHALLAYIDKFQPRKGIIFTSTQREADLIHRFLVTNGFDAIEMHGGLTQAKREYSLREFRQHARFLISTNLAARGLDIPDISDIINYDAPDEPKTYVHRVGRSARMGKDGRAFTIFGFEQRELLHATQRSANIKMNHLELDTKKFENVQIPERQRGFRGGGFRGRGGRPEGHRGGGFHGARGGGSGFRGARDRGNRHGGGGRKY
ncbi:MAG: DEAD/DEAH box helicase [Candidatus Micrarchaeota archaeon]|nr:DEAD/DEAH box helicase [Candidatus Micrarchaeota archaeon]